MANIKISQLPNINGNLTSSALLPIVQTKGTLITDKITVANLANFIVGQTGNLFVSANISNLAYNVINGAQPNITSVGTLSNLNVTGFVNLGSVNSLTITGGSNGQVLVTNGSGVLSWGNSSGATGATGPVGDRYATSSVSNLTIATGNISLNVEQGLAYTVGQDITVTHDFGNYMAGPIISYEKLTGALTFDSITTLGSGSYNSWAVNLDGAVGAQGATGSTGATGPIGLTGATGIAGGDGATGATGSFNGNLTGNVDANGFNISNAGNITANYFVGVATDVVVEAVNNNYSYHVVLTTGAGDSTLHNDIDDNFQYNPQDGILTVTRADTQYISVSNSVLSNLIPFDDLPYTLGNNTNKWEGLYVDGNIYIGNTTIGSNGNTILVDNISVANIGTIGNIATVNLDGNSSNILFGNGVFANAGTVIGATGATGPQGDVGATGASGYIGLDGSTGATGPAGVDGATGSTGPTGDHGATGPQGATGEIGSTGAEGTTGATGAIGSTGATGIEGPSGATGIQGSTGPAGTSVQIIGSVLTVGIDPQATLNAAFPSATDGSGVIDETSGNLWVKTGGVWSDVGQIQGPEGSTGATGVQGATGIQGATGETGSTGPQGDHGATGAVGSTGATGIEGPTGATGIQGDHGATGAVGSTGATGATGDSGVIAQATAPLDTTVLWVDTSDSGADGATGATGATGVAGPTGATGTQGDIGATGATGLGATGATGVAGPTGATGPATTLYFLEVYSNAVYTLPGSYTNDTCRYNIVSSNVNISSSWFNTSTYRFTPQKAGYWQITATYDVYRNSEATLGIMVNGIALVYSGSISAVSAQVTKIVYLNGTTDYVTCFNNGFNSNARTQDATRSWFQARWVGE